MLNSGFVATIFGCMYRLIVILLLFFSSVTASEIDCSAGNCQDGGGDSLVIELPSKIFDEQKVFCRAYVVDSETGKIDTSYSGTLNILINSGIGSIIPPSTMSMDPAAELTFGVNHPINEAALYEIIFRADNIDDYLLSIPLYPKVDCDGVSCLNNLRASAIDLASDPDLIVADAATLLLVSAINDSSGLYAGNYNGTGTINVLSGPGELIGNNIVSGNFVIFFADMIFTQAGQYSLQVILEGAITDTFRINVMQPSTVEEIGKKEFNLYPNPSNEDRALIFTSDKSFTQISILDLQGKVVFRQSLNNQNSFRIIDHGLTSGVYLVNAVDEKGKVYYQKLIIK